MYGGGAGALKPWGWHSFLQHLPCSERGALAASTAGRPDSTTHRSLAAGTPPHTPLHAYYRRLLSRDARVRDAAVSHARLAAAGHTRMSL